MTLANLPPETLREVEVAGEIRVRDFRAVGAHKRKTESFAEKVLVNPGAAEAEVIKQVHVGDVTAELVVHLKSNLDSSVNVRFTARLFDELERVGQVGKQFNVLRDSTGGWSGIHVVDHHGGDPDTADMNFTVTNAQQ